MLGIMQAFWTPRQIESILHAKIHSTDSNQTQLDSAITSITTDSRRVKPGALFVAIPGDQFDGHDFIPQAIAQGATAIICQKPIQNLGQAILFEVQSSLEAIRKLAAEYRNRFNIPIIAVVGAVGKTTTKELLHSALQGKYKSVLKTEGSLNGFLGIPLTLLQLRTEHEAAVIEIGIDEIGAMDQHLVIVRPTHVILTKNGPEHLHQLKTVEIAASEELQAFEYARTHDLPMAVNLSDEYVWRWFRAHSAQIQARSIITYSLQGQSPAGVLPSLSGEYHSQDGLLMVHSASGSDLYRCPLPGAHHAHNLLAAIAVAQQFGLSAEQIKKGLSTFKTAFGRTETYQLDSGTTVIADYYNSNPTSMVAALTLLADHSKTGQSHAVLGDMLELGHDEERFHRELAPQLLSRQISRVWLYGPRMKWLEAELLSTHPTDIKVQHFESHEALALELKKHVTPADRVLIKGSRGMKMEKVLEALTGKSIQKPTQEA
jgi:UDP-N-acetylmuramoyl-tripeptide--D-alanyl-D-alanine ligase